MSKLKSAFLISLILTSSVSYATPPTVQECVMECEALLNSADLIIQAQKEQNNELDEAIKKLQSNNKVLEDALQESYKWYNQPEIAGFFGLTSGLLIGILVSK